MYERVKKLKPFTLFVFEVWVIQQSLTDKRYAKPSILYLIILINRSVSMSKP